MTDSTPDGIQEAQEEEPAPFDLSAGWRLLEQARKEREIRRAWAEGFKAGGEEEARRRMAEKYRELNPTELEANGSEAK